MNSIASKIKYRISRSKQGSIYTPSDFKDLGSSVAVRKELSRLVKTGLIDRVKASRLNDAQAEAQMLEFLRQHTDPQTSPMCGNSICQDRRFLANYMPDLESYFHYRNLDVSVFKELAKRWKPELIDGFKKGGKHEALADIRESIEELKYYREHFIKI